MGISTARSSVRKAPIHKKGFTKFHYNQCSLMDWFDASVSSRSERAAVVSLQLEAPPQVRSSFVAPGQYIHLKVGDLQGPFAPASAPGRAPIDMLFKRGTPLTDALAAVMM